MASIVLTVAATAGVTALGMTGIGALAIVAGAGLLGTYIDQMLFAKGTVIKGPKLDETRFRASAVGVPITRAWGCVRVAGPVIWATRFKQRTKKQKQGKSGGGTTVKTTTYSVSFACSVAEGPIEGIGRIWADNKVLDTDNITMRVYLGTDTQQVDPKILATEGVDFTPAFRGTAYVVFEDLQLERFGNHIPQMNFEVCRTARREDLICENGIEAFGASDWDTNYILVDYVARRAYVQSDAFATISPTMLEFNIDTLEYVEEHSLAISPLFGMNFMVVDEETGYLVGGDTGHASNVWAYRYDPVNKLLVSVTDLGASGGGGQGGESELLENEGSSAIIMRHPDTGAAAMITSDVLELRVHNYPALTFQKKFDHPTPFDDWQYGNAGLGAPGEAWILLIKISTAANEIRVMKLTIDSGGTVTQTQVDTFDAQDAGYPIGSTIGAVEGPNVMYDPFDNGLVFWTYDADGPTEWRVMKWRENEGIVWSTDITLDGEATDGLTRGHHRLDGDYWYFGTVFTDDYIRINLKTGERVDFNNQVEAPVDSNAGWWNDAEKCWWQITDMFPTSVTGFPAMQRCCFHLTDLGSVVSRIKSVNLIPGYGDFTYATEAVTDSLDDNTGEREALSAHGQDGSADFIASLAGLQSQMTAVTRVSMVTGWTCDDLRCDTSKIRPRPEVLDPPGRSERPSEYAWIVSDTDRSEADSTITLQADGLPYGGGTPSDRSIKDGIEHVLAQGLNLTFVCKLYMDIPPGNSLTNPYDGTSGQDAFPWTGRITLNAAPGQGGSTYKLAGAVTEIGTFFGNEVATNFGAFSSGTIPFSGTPTSWTYRRMVLHYAKLCEQAGMTGPDDVFVIGTDLTGLTHIQDNTAAFPAVDELIALLVEVKKVWTDAGKTPPLFTYAAHWTEWNVNHANDGSGDILFHLDDIWNHADIASIGINFYAPLSDWRDGTSHLDAATYSSIYDVDYLKSQIEGGEEYTYEYTSQANRDSQTRSTIDDPDAANEDWVFRRKDIQNWWKTAHHNRPAGVRSGTPNSWVVKSKPVWLMSVGTGAHDKSTNQPDAFYDPDSEDVFGGLAYYSNGSTDNLIQTVYLEALIGYWEGSVNNPDSQVYDSWMIDLNHVCVTGWDHRPYPLWPSLTDVWGDTERWSLGRWISGRIGAAAASNIISDILTPLDIDYDTSLVNANVAGYFVSATVSARDIINPLSTTFFFDAYESEGKIKFRNRGGIPVLTLTESDMTLRDDNDEQALHGPVEFQRGQETELPGIVRIQFIGDDPDYSMLPVQTQREFGNSLRVAESRPNIVMSSAEGQQVADILMHEAWVSREEASANLMPSKLALDASDVVSIDFANRIIEHRIMRIGAEYIKPTQLVRTDQSIYVPVPRVVITTTLDQSTGTGIPLLEILDLPLLGIVEERDYAPWLAATAFPWPGDIAVYRITGTSFTLDTIMPNPAAFGTTVTALPIGVHGIFNRGATLDLDISSIADLQSVAELDVLNGLNVGALKHSTGAWEIIQWTSATLLAPNQYRLKGLLRAQQGADVDLDTTLAVGARFVLLDESLLQSNIPTSMRNIAITWEYGPSSGVPGDPEFEQTVFTPIGVGLRPLMPARSVARKDHSNNDIIFKWIRRTRIDGAIWDNVDVPLGETLERYKILIYNGSVIVRTIVVDDTNTGTYTTAQQTTDSFAVGTSLDWGVLQVSGEFGDGAERKITSAFLA